MEQVGASACQAESVRPLPGNHIPGRRVSHDVGKRHAPFPDRGNRSRVVHVQIVALRHPDIGEAERRVEIDRIFDVGPGDNLQRSVDIFPEDERDEKNERSEVGVSPGVTAGEPDSLADQSPDPAAGLLGRIKSRSHEDRRSEEVLETGAGIVVAPVNVPWFRVGADLEHHRHLGLFSSIHRRSLFHRISCA